MDIDEKRKYKRLSVELELSCYKVGSAAERLYTGRTVNVSPGGLYFQTTADAFQPGNLLRVELFVPPTTGLLEFGGRISSFAKVLRAEAIDRIHDTPYSSYSRYGVALEFCRSPKLCT